MSGTLTSTSGAETAAAGVGSVDYVVGDDWGQGFTGAMTVGAGDAALDGWTVAFDASFTITNIWNAVIVSHVGNHYVIGNAAWNGSVAAGGSTDFGFQATPGAGGTAADDFTLNGVAVGEDDPDPAPLPSLSIRDGSIEESAESTGGLIRFRVSLSAASDAPVTVHYATRDGTALAGSDYVGRGGTLTFAPGETVKTLTVRLADDAIAEANETFSIDLSAPSGATLADGSATGTIVNDDVAVPLPSVSIRDGSIEESAESTGGLARFRVSLSSASDSAVTVRYATADGTATAGSDYVARSGTITFAPGETVKTLTVRLVDDAVAERDEAFSIGLSAPSGATLGDGTALGTIVNDDAGPVPPTVSIRDATSEESAESTNGLIRFRVSLSAASDGPVTVHYATADGTATAGSDYVARSGTLTFAPGETVKTLTVRLADDAVAEGDEDFAVTLSAPSGATLADASATGTIDDDDAAAAPGWLSTSGNQIVDAAGNSVQIAGVNWFGFESETQSPHGLWARSMTDMMDQMVALGFNTIRLPFNSDMLHSTTAPGGINFALNPELAGLSALEIMDKVVEYAGQVGLKVILDHHRSDVGAGASPNGLWYDGQHSEAAWIADWQMLAARYADDPTVIGADLHNEPYNGTWGDGGVNDWARAATAAGNAIGEVNPNWLIFVEGIATYEGESYWWGGNLMGVRDHPIELEVGNKLVYSAHDYPNSVYPQSWFQGADFAEDLPAKFDEMWGYIYREGIAPVYIGEFGTRLQDPKDAPWLEAITSYLSGDYDNDGVSDLAPGELGPSWTYWSWNPNSTDTGGILADDWTSVHENKLDYLEPIQFDFADDLSGGAMASSLAFVAGADADPASARGLDTGLVHDDLVLSFDLVKAWEGFGGAVTGEPGGETGGDDAGHGWQAAVDLFHEIASLWQAEIADHEAHFSFAGTGVDRPVDSDFIV